MTGAWPLVPLGELLAHYREYIEQPEMRPYPKLSVKLYGRGVVLDAPADGAGLKMRRHQLAQAGQVILSEIWGKKGAIGFVPPEGEGALCTSHFFLFDVRSDRLDPRWLQAIFKANYLEDQLDAEARGTTGYAAVRPKTLLGCEIPLPPLPEQQRIVARIEELADQVQHALALRQAALDEARRLVQRTTEAFLDDAHWRAELLGSLLAEPPRNGLSPKPEVETGGRQMLRINAVSSSPSRFVDLSAVKHVEVSREEAAPFVLKNDDVFIVRYNGDINRVAKPAIFKSADQCEVVYPDKLMRLRPHREKVVPDFLVYALNARNVRDQIEALGKTTAGNIGISGANARSFIVAVPPLSEQRRIVSRLDSLQSRVDSLLHFQVETAAQLDALLPAILDRAFKREL